MEKARLYEVSDAVSSPVWAMPKCSYPPKINAVYAHPGISDRYWYLLY